MTFAEEIRRFRESQEKLIAGSKHAYQFTSGLNWIREKLPTKQILKFARWTLRRYWRVWDKAVYTRTGKFSRIRAGLMILTTGGTIFFVIPFVADLGFDTLVYLATASRNEQIYLLGSQEIDPATGLHNIEGCYSLPCSDKDSVYFRSRAGLFEDWWYRLHGRGWWFYPEYVAGAVPYQLSRCIVTSYGFRFRMFRTYSYLLSVSCTPMKG